ncbi:MAG: Stf0 family sulfotransferase [Solirubrobacteraceae bacterium]|nr:Stf0 family sulfotransferase [Patulibacter sp.]
MTDAAASLHYFVAATPRSGSTLLCELLKASGVAGRPNEDFQALRATSRSRQPRQYFDGVNDAFVDRLAPTDPGHAETAAEFAAKLAASREAGTTPNGVYGTKVMWGYFDQLAERLATLPGLAGATLPEALEATFPNLHIVQIRRADKIGQAISLWTAVQTLTWRDEGEQRGPEPEVFYDFAAIDHLVKLQTSHEEAWTDWLGRHDFPTKVVEYEVLAEAPQERVAEVIAWLGVPGAESAEVPAPKMRQQSNGRSAEWADRYRADLEAAGATQA